MFLPQLLFLLLSSSVSSAALPNEAMMREASRFLFDRFQQLRRNGLGVEHMRVCLYGLYYHLLYMYCIIYHSSLYRINTDRL